MLTDWVPLPYMIMSPSVVAHIEHMPPLEYLHRPAAATSHMQHQPKVSLMNGLAVPSGNSAFFKLPLHSLGELCPKFGQWS